METKNNMVLPFLHDITTTWDWSDLNFENGNETPNLNLAVAALVLATNIETTVGDHAWDLVESSLGKLGFIHMAHHYFEREEKINYPAMVFARSAQPVNGKYVVAAVYRGSSSTEDFISDLKAEPGGFHKAGINASNELRAYVKGQGLTKENTALFITGHSYGAAVASLVGIQTTDLAEREAIFCYSFATPNYIRNGLTGDGMKMFCYATNEDIVPQVPVGPNLDKTGVVITFDRMDLKLRHPEQYERFLRLYHHFRDKDFDEDSDFMPVEYSFKTPVRIPVNNTVIRSHMPYTYMALILSELPDETAYAYIPRKTDRAKADVLKRDAAFTKGGKTVPEAQDPGVTWLTVEFMHDMRIAWNWADLLQDALTAGENLNLAMAALVLSQDVELSARRGEKLLQQIGFENIQSDFYRFSTATRNAVSNPARTFAHKAITKDDKTWHVICAVFKGTTTLPDTITDIASIHDGFYEAGRNCTQSLKEYVGSIPGAEKDNTIMLITGHSLGAATANVVGRLCGELVHDRAKFVYTFASPNYETQGQAEDGKAYPNFIYYTNRDDVVPTVPPRMPPHFFSKIGTERLFCYGTMDEDQKKRFLRAYRYFRNTTFEADKDLLGLGFRKKENMGYTALKNHLCHTYMAFILSELCDKQIDVYLPESVE